MDITYNESHQQQQIQQIQQQQQDIEFENNNNDNISINADDHNKTNNIKSVKKKVQKNNKKRKSVNLNGNNNNNSNQQKKQKKKYSLMHDNNYKLISPFQKYIEAGVYPSLKELNTEFYHILTGKCLELKNEIINLEKMNKNNNIPDDFDFKIQHQHQESELEKIQFNDRKLIELAVRKFCGYLNRENNMILMEMVLLSIGLVKAIEFLQLTLEIESKGGLTFEKSVNSNSDVNNNNNNIIEIKKRSPGGLFFKMVNLHIPKEIKTSIFSTNALFKYRKERNKNGVGQLPDLRNCLINIGSSNNNNNNNTDNNNNNNNINLMDEINGIDEEFDKLIISESSSNNLNNNENNNYLNKNTNDDDPFN
ncbi:hypothetical protein DICPUDRAFT_75055 [Dictyostelium purpureum]|uniref:Phosphorylated adapter RNA export protein RNA-binding domain-containing protein n=1 Tax=Dictyostelium purpureum TaxID=5786 RepID=F0Z9I1_DICPU|nr:uncharacterized protein DICPUDRAFT_75055 [Dictyostelium purpureum]EGC39413.1 hypothetical protein DICPUDRAFT_75055 [Dictyostelium purpureum]|eukprot:XP_003284087.1 hypothetical protein DICPUDRAFT_75055 [Dictyostelium purpureum]